MLTIYRIHYILVTIWFTVLDVHSYTIVHVLTNLANDKGKGKVVL